MRSSRPGVAGGRRGDGSPRPGRRGRRADLTDAHAAGLGVDQTGAAVTAAAPQPAPAAGAAGPGPAAPLAPARIAEFPEPIRGHRPHPARARPPCTSSRFPDRSRTTAAPAAASVPEVVVGLSEDAERSYGPLTEGVNIPKGLDLDPGGRNKAPHPLQPAHQLRWPGRQRLLQPPEQPAAPSSSGTSSRRGNKAERTMQPVGGMGQTARQAGDVSTAGRRETRDPAGTDRAVPEPAERRLPARARRPGVRATQPPT